MVNEVERFRQAVQDLAYVYVSDAAYHGVLRLVDDPARVRVYRLVLDRAGIEMLRVRLTGSGPAKAEGKRQP